MSRGKVGYPFKPAHAKTPTGWEEEMSFYQCLLMERLWKESENGFLPMRSDRIVCNLRISRKGDRVTAQKAVAWLLAEGWLVEARGGLNVLTSRDSRRCDAVVIAEVPSNAITTQAKTAESFKVDFTDQREEIRSEEKKKKSAGVRAREESPKLERRAPEPAPSFVPPKQVVQAMVEQCRELAGDALVTWILHEHDRRHFALTTLPARGLKRKDYAVDFARWVEGASAAYKLGNQVLAAKTLAAFFASDKGREAEYNLGFVTQCPQEFVGNPDGTAYVRKQVQRPRRDEPTPTYFEAHREYEPPAWQREEAAPPPANVMALVKTQPTPEPPARKPASPPPDSEHTASMAALVAAQLKRGFRMASPDLEPQVAGAAE